MRSLTLLALAGLLGGAFEPQAVRASDLADCANERVKTEMLSTETLAAAEAACGRMLSANVNAADRQQAAFYRGLMRFLQAVQKGAEPKAKRDGSLPAYAPPSLDQVRPALADVEAAIAIEGPLREDAQALRVTINQTIGRAAEARADIAQAAGSGQPTPTVFVQRALEHERSGDAAAALADLDRALEIEPKAATALMARASLLRRLGSLVRAREDYAQVAALGPPLRRLALSLKSDVELRLGDLSAAYDDLRAAARDTTGLPKSELAAARTALLIRVGDLALDKLKEPAAAETHYREAARLIPTEWNAHLGLARVEEQRGNKAKAVVIYKQVLAETKSTPKLVERLVATIRLKALTEPLLRRTGPFRDMRDGGVAPSAPSPDGLRRVAIVVGESEYLTLASLPNARRDAAVMANAFAEMGFDVVKLGEDLTKSDLRRLPEVVAELASDSDVALVFYAGHAVETAGANYLLPVDAVPESDRHLSDDALALGEIVTAAAKARRGSLVIVDACRDDPFVEAREVARSRGVGSSKAMSAPKRLHTGLAATPVIPNTVVFHSTQPGRAALDGDGVDSPFVRALLSTLGTPGQPLETVVRETTTRVSSQTQGQQVPALYGSPPMIALLPPATKP
ncbi:caspase family protein [Enterovirga sp. CN4-39]|uniref:caspase family protein n=1 Tax=Enterovirga sp. CN4-39 TaxID=3400910 RepID=UPI003C11ABA6